MTPGAKKKFLPTTHAKERMKRRGVTHNDIQNTLNRPTTKTRVRSDGTQEFRRRIRGRTNFVVVEHKKSVIIIVTVGWS